METVPGLSTTPGGFRVATWNTEYAFQRHTQAESWRFLWDSIQPEVALVQEAVPPPDINAVWREEGIDDRRRWGSAVVSRTRTLTPVTLAKSPWYRQEVSILRTYPGSVAVATVPLPTGEALTAISIYGLIKDGYASATVHRQLTEVNPWNRTGATVTP